MPLGESKPPGHRATVRRVGDERRRAEPEAHQALTIGIQRAGRREHRRGRGRPRLVRPDRTAAPRARIKQVASARFGVTATYLARADQLEIKIAQGSKPGEGGQLPGSKATAYIAALRRGQPGQSYISPPPHHDIYSIEDLAQLIADLRAINPRARIGVKLVAGRGVGTIAAGVAKAGASYIHLSGHAGGTGASPLSSIKHVGAPWELGLAEVHQVLLRNDLRDRVALRTDGGLQTGRDLLIAALLGAEEFAFGTAALVADRLRHGPPVPSRHVPDRHRDPARGPSGQVHRHAGRRSSATSRPSPRTSAASSPRSAPGRSARSSARAGGCSPPIPLARAELAPVIGAAPWGASPARRADPAGAGRESGHAPASALEVGIAAAFRGQGSVSATGLRVTTADRSFGAGLTGASSAASSTVPSGSSCGAPPASRSVPSPVPGSSCGLPARPTITSPRACRAARSHRPRTRPRRRAATEAIAGNTVLYGATGGRLHLVGRAGMRFAVRNSGAEAVVEGIGPHGCEYMTGGTVVVLGPVGANFGAGMTGGRAYLYDPSGRHTAALDERSVGAVRLATALADRPDGQTRVIELIRLLEAHRSAGSELAGRLLDEADLAARFWLVEPNVVVAPATVAAAGSRPGIGHGLAGTDPPGSGPPACSPPCGGTRRSHYRVRRSPNSSSLREPSGSASVRLHSGRWTRTQSVSRPSHDVAFVSRVPGRKAGPVPCSGLEEHERGRQLADDRHRWVADGLADEQMQLYGSWMSGRGKLGRCSSSRHPSHRRAHQRGSNHHPSRPISIPRRRSCDLDDRERPFPASGVADEHDDVAPGGLSLIRRLLQKGELGVITVTSDRRPEHIELRSR